MIDVEHYRDLLQTQIRGRRIILATGSLVSGTALAKQMIEDLSAERCLVIADSRGSGDVSEHESIEHIQLDLRAPDLLTALTLYQTALTNPSDDLVAAVDRFDPQRLAIVILEPLYSLPSVAGRPVLGARQPAWARFERKLLADALWDEAGIARAASTIVPAEHEALCRAARFYDVGAGTCWAGDAHQGINGGATYLRWIRRCDDDHHCEIDEALQFFANNCGRVRVMPFLEGIPCSIHGLVFGKSVIVFRPVEIIVFRRPNASKLAYAGVATFWDPQPGDREAMREAARKVGVALRETVGYRGGFTVDGVMSEDGFRPTELNARLGAGRIPIGQACPDLPLLLLEMLIRERTDLDYRPADLESMIVRSADNVRGGGSTLFVSAKLDAASYPLEVTVDGVQIVADDQAADGKLITRPCNEGGSVHFKPNVDRTPLGEPFAPRVARAFAFADEQFKTGIGPLEPASSRRA